MSLLEVGGLTKQFGGWTAVDDLSFEVDGGEIVGAIGPNVAGRTTMLYSIAGFKEYSGSISDDGMETAETGSGKLVNEGLVYCTEDRELFPRLDERRNQEAQTMSGGE